MKRLVILSLVFLFVAPACDDDAPTDAGTDADTDTTTDADFDQDSQDSDIEDTDVDQPELGGLGAACETPDDCQGDLCVPDSLLPGFHGGYCSQQDCTLSDPDSCGSDGVCLSFEASFGEPLPNICLQSCDTDETCRDGYACAGICIGGELVVGPEVGDQLDSDDELIRQLIGSINEDRMRERIRILSGEIPWNSPDGEVTIRSRAVQHPDHSIAIAYLESLDTQTGLTTTRVPFTVEKLDLVNLEIRIEGTDTSLAPAVFTAHFDSTASHHSGWNPATDPAPGAIDNAASIAALLEIAQGFLAMAKDNPIPRTAIFLFYDGEELGWLGSSHHVNTLVSDGQGILCALNLDQIGWNTTLTPNRFWLQHQQDFENLAAFDLEAIEDFVPQAQVIPTQDNEYTEGASDHAPFWINGICATSMSCFPNPPVYHTPDDVLENGDWDFLMTSVRSAAAIAAARVYHWVE